MRFFKTAFPVIVLSFMVSCNGSPEIVNSPANAAVGWDAWFAIALASLVFNVALFLLLRRTVNRKEKYRMALEICKHNNKVSERRINQLSEDKNTLLNKGRQQPAYAAPQNIRRERPKISEPVEEKSPEIPLSVHSTSYNSPKEPVKEPVCLYAEKADARIFTSVTEHKDDYKSIFKLFLEDIDAEIAQFEVLDSDFVLKMAANSPDTYLYSVCKPENSNQDFSGEIITVQKGIAYKIEGKWQVNDENKAKIKFQ